MCPFSVTVEHVPDRELGPLVARLSEAGFANPIITHVGTDGPSEASALPRASGRRTCQKPGASCTSGRASHIAGRSNATATRPIACSWARRGQRVLCRSDSAKRSARTPGGATASTSLRFSAAARRSIRSLSSSPLTTSKPRASSWRSSAAATELAACTGSATSCQRSTRSTSGPRSTTSESCIRAPGTGRRRRSGGRPRYDAQPRAHPEPTALSNLGMPRGARVSAGGARWSCRAVVRSGRAGRSRLAAGRPGRPTGTCRG